MQRFLLIETSTAVCSVSLSEDTGIIARRQSAEPRVHASMLAVFIDEILRECGLQINDCAAVAVSGGPGSYTGLRVGVSTAKGLCFGASIPLIHVSSLELIAQLYVEQAPLGDLYRIFPMIDARRMEVYTAPFSATGSGTGMTVQRTGADSAVTVTEDSFLRELDSGLVVFTGDGAEKCRNVISHPNARFVPLESHADGMAKAAAKAYAEKDFRDVAYYTPFYLKEFRITPPKTDAAGG